MLLFIFYCLQLLLHFHISSQSDLLSNECSALYEFRNSFTPFVYLAKDPNFAFGDYECHLKPYYRKRWDDHYQSGTNCCEWDGVTCDSTFMHVVEVDLSCHLLIGDLHSDSSLFQLTHLQKLNLAFNDFSQSQIPSQLGQLCSLTHLNLSTSNLRGPVPSEISYLSKLQSLDLSSYNNGNNFKANALGMREETWKRIAENLTDIHELILPGVNFSSIPLPSVFKNLTSSLITLDLSNCALTGNHLTIPHLPKLVKLDLSINFLSMSLENIVNNFSSSVSLQMLDLSRCYLLHGEIPTSLANLTQLSDMDLSFNNLSGLIPPWLFSELPNLESLSISQNQLVGSLPVQVRQLHYHKLRDLDLSHNFLSGPIPVWCFTLPSISSLDLSFNQFNLIRDFSPAVSPSLANLRLQNNNLQGFIPISVFTLMNLRYLDLSSNNFSGFFNSNISHNNLAPKLFSLDLSHNNIHGVFPKWLQAVAKDSLVTLNLSSNYLERIELLQWSQLQIIHLSSNSLEGEVPIPPRNTQVFSVSKNKLTGGIFRSICNLNTIQILDLSHNKFSGNLPQCLGNITGALNVLDLQMNNLHGTIPKTFMMDASNLQTLKLGGNKFTGLLPRSLASCRQLEVLDVGNNHIEDEFPNWLESIPNLQVLVLRNNNFHGHIGSPHTENPFSRLRILDISNNYLKGPLSTTYIMHLRDMMNIDVNETREQYMVPNTFYDASYQDSIKVTMKGIEIELQRILTIFTTFDVSNNQFDGKIPQVIGYLKSLKGLNLSHNMLNGSIPPSFANLSSLEWLDLSSNMLTGMIPSNMAILTSLEVFNVSYNQLIGSIPEANQFNTFPNSSYIGNVGLCGKPLSRGCNTDSGEPSPSSTSDHDDSQEVLFRWKLAFMGYACGFVFGGSIAYFILSTGKPWWLVKMLLKSSKLKKLYLQIQ